MRQRGIVCLVIFAGGCTAAPSCHNGTRIVAYTPGAQLGVEPVPYTASYILYQPPIVPAGASSGEGSLERWTLRELKQGGWIGFSREENGQLIAIAGSERIPLADGAYCWHVSPETQYSATKLFLLGAEDTARKTAMAIVRFPLELAGVILLVAFSGPGANWGP